MPFYVLGYEPSPSNIKIPKNTKLSLQRKEIQNLEGNIKIPKLGEKEIIK